MSGKACCFIKNDLNLPLFLTRDLTFKRIKLKNCFLAFSTSENYEIKKYYDLSIKEQFINSLFISLVGLKS